MSFFQRLKNIITSNINAKEGLGKDFAEYDEILSETKTTETVKNDKEKEYYEILELKYGAPFSQIKAAYKKLLKKYHPDFFRNNEEKYQKAVIISKKINEAYSYFERKNI